MVLLACPITGFPILLPSFIIGFPLLLASPITGFPYYWLPLLLAYPIIGFPYYWLSLLLASAGRPDVGSQIGRFHGSNIRFWIRLGARLGDPL